MSLIWKTNACSVLASCGVTSLLWYDQTSSDSWVRQQLLSRCNPDIYEKKVRDLLERGSAPNLPEAEKLALLRKIVALRVIPSSTITMFDMDMNVFTYKKRAMIMDSHRYESLLYSVDRFIVSQKPYGGCICAQIKTNKSSYDILDKCMKQ